MNYSKQILDHFYEPRNVGIFDINEQGVGTAVVGSYENGAVIHFQLKIKHNLIIAAKFKAYGNCPIIAACSYATDWLIDKTIERAKQLTSLSLMEALAIPELKIHCALLVEDAVKQAIIDYFHQERD